MNIDENDQASTVVSHGKLRSSLEESTFERELGELEQQIDMIITESNSSPSPTLLRARPSKIHTELSIARALPSTDKQPQNTSDLLAK
jgi:hypothetical protein